MAETILNEDMLRRWSVKRIQKEFPTLSAATIEKLKKVALSQPDMVEVRDR